MSESQAQIDEALARELLGRERGRIESALADRRRLRRGEVEEIDAATDPADDAQTVTDEEVDDALIQQLRAELEAVERAERRLEDGTYGLSVESGEPIPAERLETIPWAERTAEEQARYERTHGGGP
jgi:DnaK suppressor protein